MAKAPETGRPSKLNSEVQDRIVAAIRAGNYPKTAADYAGITERTFYRWLQRGQDEDSGIYHEFAQAVQRAESEAEVCAVAILQRHMADNWRAAVTFLERKFPERWGRRARIEVEIDPRKALAELLNLSEDEIDEAVDEAARRP